MISNITGKNKLLGAFTSFFYPSHKEAKVDPALQLGVLAAISTGVTFL